MAIVGNLNVDVWVRPVDRFPSVDEEQLVDSAQVELAGTAGYALLACHALKMDAITVSTIGDDSFGALIEQEAKELGVTLECVEILPGQETPVSMVFIGSDGSRSILSTLGAHGAMDLDVVTRHDEQIARCRELFICGSYLLPRLGPHVIKAYAETARARGQTVVFDPSWDPAGWGECTRRQTRELLPAVDVYLPNEQELLHLTGRAHWHEAVHDVADLPGELVVKRGANGATFVNAGEWIDTPAFEVEAVNTIGAGDVFDIGYLYGRRRGWPVSRRLEFAAALAAIVVRQQGRRRYPSAEQVYAFLREELGEGIWNDAGPA